jgi:hypothetical protein
MMFTKEYIEKVSKAKEIQEKRKNADDYMVGDYVLLTLPKKFDTVRLVDWDVWGDIKKQGTELDDFEGKAKYYWLPTLEQLFEIHTKYYPVGILSMVFELNKWLQNSFFKNYKSLNEAMLTLIMEKIYSKQWNPDKRKWEAKNE